MLGCRRVEIPTSHPRYRSLVTRERIAKGVRDGLVHDTGLLAHGRGEAFDYLLGERTIESALAAERVAAAHLLLAERPVISVNGNTAVLCGAEIAALQKASRARVEVNLFHRTEDRVARLVDYLTKAGCRDVLGKDAAPRIPGLDHARALTSAEGIAVADVVLVPLEDGDRAEALRRMGKVVLAIDLNPLSRTARAGSVTIVDEVTRAIPEMTDAVETLRPAGRVAWGSLVAEHENSATLAAALRAIRDRLDTEAGRALATFGP
ncbi:MAG: 4-phosphopantoate--beta-alanine ligase [Thermoplasmatota archaeon]